MDILEKMIDKIINEEMGKHSKKQVDEKLHGKQKKLDKNKNNKIDAEDFKMLRGKKEVKETEKADDEKMTRSQMNTEKRKLNTKKAAGEKLTAKEESRLKHINSKLNSSSLNESKNKIRLTETELIDLIEEIVLEVDAKAKSPEGLKVTSKAQKESGKENKAALNDTAKKMKEYAGKMYDPNPKTFPKTNGGDKMKYHPSNAVEEYIENFAYAGGLDDLDYDEIEPNEEWIGDNIKGSSRTGNNPEWANAEKTELGEKILKRRKLDPFNKEKNKSYKRVSQPVDVAGKDKKAGSLDKMFSKLESLEKNPIIKEEMEKIKHLMNY